MQKVVLYMVCLVPRSMQSLLDMGIPFFHPFLIHAAVQADAHSTTLLLKEKLRSACKAATITKNQVQVAYKSDWPSCVTVDRSLSLSLSYCVLGSLTGRCLRLAEASLPDRGRLAIR